MIPVSSAARPRAGHSTDELARLARADRRRVGVRSCRTGARKTSSPRWSCTSSEAIGAPRCASAHLSCRPGREGLKLRGLLAVVALAAAALALAATASAANHTTVTETVHIHGANNSVTLTFRASGSDGSSLIVHETEHFAMNANGQVTVSFNRLSLNCG
jgi:hypothetical protein